MRCHILCYTCHSLLLNSLGIHRMLILMLRARHTEEERLIWVRNLKSRDRPRLSQSTIERLSLSHSIPLSCTGQMCAVGCFDQGPGFKSATQEQTRRHLWKAWICLPSLGRNYLSQFRVKRNWTTKTVTENFTAATIDTKTSTFKGMTTGNYSPASPSSYFWISTHRSDISWIPETLYFSVTGREASLARTPESHGLAQCNSIKIMTPTEAWSSSRALIQRGYRRWSNLRANW